MRAESKALCWYLELQPRERFLYRLVRRDMHGLQPAGTRPFDILQRVIEEENAARRHADLLHDVSERGRFRLAQAHVAGGEHGAEAGERRGELLQEIGV